MDQERNVCPWSTANRTCGSSSPPHSTRAAELSCLGTCGISMSLSLLRTRKPKVGLCRSMSSILSYSMNVSLIYGYGQLLRRTLESMFTSQVICEQVLRITTLKIRIITFTWLINACNWKAKAMHSMKRGTPWVMKTFRSIWMTNSHSIISASKMISCLELKTLLSTHFLASSEKWIVIIVPMYMNCLVSIFFWMKTSEFGSSSAITIHSWEHHVYSCALSFPAW